MTKYEPLPEIVEIHTIGIPDMTATLVKRTAKKAIYKRWDNVWEVFRIRKEKERKIFNNTYPPMEIYPTNEDFGSTAWCFTNIKLAEELYNNLP